jgi:hypothetical protein
MINANEGRSRTSVCLGMCVGLLAALLYATCPHEMQMTHVPKLTPALPAARATPYVLWGRKRVLQAVFKCRPPVSATQPLVHKKHPLTPGQPFATHHHCCCLRCCHRFGFGLVCLIVLCVHPPALLAKEA